MRCGDLERYLEAFLDGRLGRSRTAVLRRHLALCGACQARVERLRQFERDTQRRFRAPDQPGSVWEGLELDLVGSQGAVVGRRSFAAPLLVSSLPGGDPAPARSAQHRTSGHPLVPDRQPARGNASRLVGVLMIALALGAAYQFVRGELEPESDGSATKAYLAFRNSRAAPTLSSDDAGQTADWLAGELGRPVPVPTVPDGFQLVGATHADLAGRTAGALIYDQPADPDTAPVMLFVQAGGDGTGGSLPSAADGGSGLEEVRWAVNSLSYVAVGPFPAERLLQFQR